VLNGIGGRTVEEAQHRMSYREYIAWIKYMQKNGSINPGRRVDNSLALIAMQFARPFLKKQSGEKFTMEDFTMYPVPVNEVDASPQQVFDLINAVAQSNNE